MHEEYEASVRNLRHKIQELTIACTEAAGISSVIHAAFDRGAQLKLTLDEASLLKRIQ